MRRQRGRATQEAAGDQFAPAAPLDADEIIGHARVMVTRNHSPAPHLPQTGDPTTHIAMTIQLEGADLHPGLTGEKIALTIAFGTGEKGDDMIGLEILGVRRANHPVAKFAAQTIRIKDETAGTGPPPAAALQITSHGSAPNVQGLVLDTAAGAAPLNVGLMIPRNAIAANGYVIRYRGAGAADVFSVDGNGNIMSGGAPLPSNAQLTALTDRVTALEARVTALETP